VVIYYLACPFCGCHRLSWDQGRAIDAMFVHLSIRHLDAWLALVERWHALVERWHALGRPEPTDLAAGDHYAYPEPAAGEGSRQDTTR